MKAGTFLKENINLDERGMLSSVEAYKETGCLFKRYFLIKNIIGGKRGGHAHKFTDQIIKLIDGSMNIKYENNFETKLININNDSPPIFFPRLTWIEMNDIDIKSTILVLATDEYDINNSLRTYSEFKEYILQK